MAATPRPLKVAIVAASLRILGGQAVQAQRLLDGWREDPDVRAWLVPINPVPPAWLAPSTRVKYLRTVMTQLCYWPLLVRELRHADVVHIFSASYSSFVLSPLPAIVVAKLLGRPVLLNYHSGEAPDHLARSPLARRVLRNWVDLNVVPSTFLRDVFDSFNLAATVVTNTVDLSAFRYRMRDRLRPRLLSTRNFEPVYNVACTIRAFADVQSRYHDASLTLVGAGSQDRELRTLAAELGLRNVTFVGRVEPHEIARYYDAADIYVQTPSIDNQPLSVLEAVASGLPVVSTGVGGVPAMLNDGQHGLLAPPGDAIGIARQITRLLQDPPLARRLAATAHATCSDYEWPVARKAWLQAYNEVLARPRRARSTRTKADRHDIGESRSAIAEQTESA